MRRVDRLWLPLVSLLVRIVSAVGFLEVVLRLLPTNEHPRPQPVNAASPVMRFQPDREFTWS